MYNVTRFSGTKTFFSVDISQLINQYLQYFFVVKLQDIYFPQNHTLSNSKVILTEHASYCNIWRKHIFRWFLSIHFPKTLNIIWSYECNKNQLQKIRHCSLKVPVSINVKYKSFSINVLELRRRKGKYNSQTIYLFKE